MEPIDQTHIFEEYKGQWVLLDQSRTKVLAADYNLKKAVAKFRKKFDEKETPVLFKVPTKLMPYIGTG